MKKSRFLKPKAFTRIELRGVISIIVLLLSIPMPADAEITWDTYSDTWVGTDALGRVLPTHEEVGDPRPDRTICIFYFINHGAHIMVHDKHVYRVDEILAADPNAVMKPDSPLWGPFWESHYWGESLFGFYRSDDPFVLRKHAHMLADAGVDAIVFDNSNQLTYPEYHIPLYEVFDRIRSTGQQVPKVAHLCSFGIPNKTVHELYNNLYSKGLYEKMWFRWEGKPLMLANPAAVSRCGNNPDQLAPGQTLGQSFRVDKPFYGVAGIFPTWATTGSAMTMTLRCDGPEGNEIATHRFENVSDNASLWIHQNEPLPPGTYYLEISQAQGTIGWWGDSSATGLIGEKAYLNGVPVAGRRTTLISFLLDEETSIHDFFTFRAVQPSLFDGPPAKNWWSWMEIYPQHMFTNDRDENEQMSVSVAQNANDNDIVLFSDLNKARGRNYHDGANDRSPDAVLHGYNFAEQWARALKLDPKVIFISSWNELFAGRLDPAAWRPETVPVLFCDSYDQVNSRDAEPVKGMHGDNYYYQIVANVRRFKGVRPIPKASKPKTIDLNGSFSQWDDVAPEFRDHKGDTVHRNFPGFKDYKFFTNTTGRNDIQVLKVARDAANIYFYARTGEPITSYTDPHWMMLFIKVGGDPRTGWEGYQYVVNRQSPDSGMAVLEESPEGWNWTPKAEIPFTVSGNEIMLTIPRNLLGLEDSTAPLQLDFKWADNIQAEGEIDEFTINGDSAPPGRFNYRYEVPPVCDPDYPVGDLNSDCVVDLSDFSLFSAHWLQYDPGANLISNGSFEDPDIATIENFAPLPGWYTQGTYTLADQSASGEMPAADGTQFVRVLADVIFSQSVTVTPGATYTISLNYTGHPGNPGTEGILIRNFSQLDGGAPLNIVDTHLSYSGENSVANPDWQYAEWAYTVPQGGATAMVAIQIFGQAYGALNGQLMTLDNFKVIKKY